MTALRLPLFREITALLLLLALMLQSATAVAPGPAWWNTQNVLDPYSVADDFAVANVGQLKYMAAKAAAAMEAALPGGAGEPINTMVSDWSLAPASGVTRDNYLAINQGQLKHVAAPFYVRLGLPYPWAGGSAVKDNYKLVNLGQLKYVFSFALNSRTAGQGAVQIPTAMLTAALAQWQALPVKPVGSSTDDFDGDGIPNLQEYLMNSTLFDPLDIDGDRILDSVEDAHPGVLSKLRFADAVADYDGDGVMNFEEVLLGLNLSSATTSGRVDAMSDAKVLAWGLAARKPLVDSVVAGTDALKTFWGQIDAAWITANVGNDYLNWLDATVVNGVAKGLTAFRTDVLTNHVWEPWNPGAAGIGGTPSVFHDANGNTIDMDGDSVPDFDRDADYLPDLWEYRYALNLRDSQDATKDPDGDLLTNLQEYQAGTNPRLADSDGDGFADKAELVQLAQGADPLNGAAGLPLVLVLASGNFQTVTAGGGSAPLVIHVTQGGLPVSGAQVQFAVGTGGGSLRAANVAAATGTPVSMTTDANGTASAVYLAAASTGTAGVTATLGSSSGGSSVNFSLTIAEASATYAYESSNAAPFGGVVGAFGAGNVPRSDPFVDPVLQADSKFMWAEWDDWTDAAGKENFKSDGYIGHSWDSPTISATFLDNKTNKTAEIVKRFKDEPYHFHANPRDGSGSLSAPSASYTHYYEKYSSGGPWYAPARELEVQSRDVTALKVVTYVPQKEPAEMTFLALVYRGDTGPSPNPSQTLLTSGVVHVKGSASTWSKSLDVYCTRKEDGTVIVDPGPEGERTIAKTDNKYIQVVLLRVEIKRDIAGGEVLWEQVLGRAAKALPGQKINLKLELPMGITASDYHWSSSNWFKDYSEPPTHEGGHRVAFEPSDLTGQEMHFYWSGTGNKTVSVNCLINGARVFFHQEFDVVKPSCTFEATQDPTTTGPGWGYRSRFACNATVDKLPTVFTDGANWMFLQMVRVTNSIVPSVGPPNKCNEFDGEWCLDTRADWAPRVSVNGLKADGETNSFTDSPFGDANSTVGSERYDDDFRTYVMFKSKEPDARWVPLKVINWGFGFTSTVTGSLGNEDQTFTSSYPQAPRQLTGTETALHPEWSHIVSFGVVQKNEP